ncbi:hypothetical protein T439DRAFT_326007 [Meredithblackwellia eburnea MCA 4105]
MTRGLQKEQARAKAQEKLAKAQGGKSQLKVREKALAITCSKCYVSMLDYKSFKIHWEAKHDGPAPDEAAVTKK